MGIVNMLLTLEAGKRMLALPRPQAAPLEGLMRDLREQAARKADATHHKANRTEHEHWRVVAMYAKYMTRAFKRENLRQEKEAAVAGLLESIGVSAQPLPKSVRQFAGSEAMKGPSTDQTKCLIELAGREFRPWAEKGDLLQIDFSMTHLHGDSLYLVAVDHYLQLTGFRKTEAGWVALKNHHEEPVQVEMIEDRLPRRYEVVGRVVHIFKGPDLEAAPPKSQKRNR
jgi:hypothetical protein